MKLEDAREHYYTFSGKLSDVNRHLCFAGIAVIWIFAREDSTGDYSVPDALITPLAFFVLGLSLDLIHYLIATISWSSFHRIKEKESIGEEADFDAPSWINWTPLIFFYGKVISNFAGYGLLMKFIWAAVL